MPATARRARPQITIIGAGRLGAALALALERERYPIVAVVARKSSSAKKAAALLDASPLTLGAKNLARLPAGGVVIVATPDDQIEGVARKLAGLATTRNRRAILHTSGALSSAVLSPLKRCGWSIGSMHPLIAVSDSETGANTLREAFWCLEGNKHAVQVARTIVTDLDGHCFSIKSEQKSLYHAAAVMASGNIVSLFDVAVEMLNHCGLALKTARQVLSPLVTSAVANLSRSDPPHALTGTFARGDEATVDRHLKALSLSHLETARLLYRLLGQRSVELALKAGGDKRSLERIRRKLQ